MADYDDLFSLLQEQSDVKNKVIIACVVATETIRTENPATTNHANRQIWARQVLRDPIEKGNQMWTAVLAANNGLTLNQIQTASDAGIQTAVNNAIDLVADGS